MQDEQHASVAPQDKLASAPVFLLPRSKGHLFLEVAVCNKKIDSVLMQKQLDRTKKPLAYWLMTLHTVEQNNDKQTGSF